jgi:DeoR/GlpR family transcriptional regulator of sugar metabolism
MSEAISVTVLPLKAERQGLIRKLVEAEGRVTVPDLSARLGVSRATIRRDLEELHRRGWLQRSHGGAVRIDRAAREPPMPQRLPEHPAEKRRIAQEAAHLVQDGETIFLGSGTTVLEVARALPGGLHLTVITNSLAIVNELAAHPCIELIVIGGMFRQSELSMVGHLAEQAIRELRADRVFLGMRAIDANYGFASDFLPEIMTDRAILSIAPQVVVVADHTKFGRVGSVVVAPVTAAHLIITDTATPPETVAELQALGLQVRTV